MISGRTVVDGRFELLEPLGSGGMGTVWRAYDLALHREVALKEVRAADGDDASSAPGVQRERVLREARALARIGHPNVVAVHHIVDSPAAAHPWIVMELVRGRTLAEQLALGPMSPAHAAQIGRGILAGLRAAHQVGVLHRDIKPANILLREDGSPVLTDFGIAAIYGATSLTATGNLLGSLDYVAPERLSGQEGNPASDLWSLGLVLFVAVEGYHPMRRDTTVATLAAVLQGTVPHPRQAGPLTPILQALLAADPNHRPPAEQVDGMLTRVVNAPGASAVPVQVQVPVPPISANHPAPKPFPRGILIGGAVAIMTAVVLAMVALRPESTRSAAEPTNPPVTGRPQTSAISAGPGPSSVGPSPSPAATDLLTPEGVRQAIAALEKASGGTEFTKVTFYSTYVNAEAPVRDQPTLYDEYVYRNGVGSRKGAGGELSETATVRLSSIDWNILPTLLRTADEKLGVPKPTLRYVIVNPAWTFNDDRPTLLVYLTDDYGGAYLAADVDGTVVSMYPRGR
ncbi:serine/threonine-protein kinase [Nocardia sp. NPDC050710]|uniref:serine/threonine-protein kinase n=1 Tax=Nocardia sp. NPDC050710 TaxID=3157220 RepID=UPI0033E47933